VNSLVKHFPLRRSLSDMLTAPADMLSRSPTA